MAEGGEVSMAEYNKFMAEGQTFEQGSNYAQAVECYTQALEAISVGGVLQDDIGKHCYCMRSRCYLKIGQHDEALQDAESALNMDKDLITGIYAKAEALYFKGDFEFALLFYHIGNQMRPDMKKFKLGIQKAREAIDNAIGSTKKCTLTTEGDLTMFHQGLEATAGKKRVGGQRRKGTARNRSARPGPQTNDKTVKQLLGELYADRAYLESLVNDPSLRLGQGGDIKTLAASGLQYLDKRTEFWRQQKPIYVREQERKEQKGRISTRTSRMATAGKPKKRPVTQEAKTKAQSDLERALQAYRSMRPDKCIEACEDVLRVIKSPETRDEREIVGLAHSLKGASLYAKENYQEALKEHTMDLDVSVEDRYRMRALCQIARCNAIIGELREAASAWVQAAGMQIGDLTAAWLHHELGRCYLELGDVNEALDSALAGLDAAELAESREWTLYLTILKAQAQEQNNQRTEAYHTFKAAAELAGDLYKRDLKNALLKAAQDAQHANPDAIQEERESHMDLSAQDGGGDGNDDADGYSDDGDDDDDDGGDGDGDGEGDGEDDGDAQDQGAGDA
ncbi:hypothetical protein PTSG_00210 [Salpingoeca rosetta]|uniref:Outer dynein arm-docking complex subunit 4 n=1 Tax=Salpingoeca rosetta (strain ATCC 50818 / BSB-021) TaxID=946362 RepID=F2TVU2_SALR5|nr:uncharacterized protein PTSG_00210 [Salpingoeca rosetta]EGD72188.1 hypothetical protein PTSG_00210 [Salpingoeca rosetta]|eukprot:XP_004998759.1 hypothetical protein PTSG_00210 [Salpingoeca rosetta]